MPECEPWVRYADVPNRPGYKVGTDGSLWTAWARAGRAGGGPVWRIGSEWRRLSCRLVKGRRNPEGYVGAILRHSGRRHHVLVHRVMLECFVGPPPGPGYEAAHEDGNQFNNEITNLSWKTHKANMDDRDRHGTTARGERNGLSKLTAAQVREIRALARGPEFLTKGELASLFGVHRQAIHDLLKGRTWKHVA